MPSSATNGHCRDFTAGAGAARRDGDIGDRLAPQTDERAARAGTGERHRVHAPIGRAIRAVTPGETPSASRGDDVCARQNAAG